MASLHTHFGQNVLHDEDEWRLVLDETISTACPISPATPRRRRPSERGLDGKYVITLARSSVEPFLMFSARRDLRETAYRGLGRSAASIKASTTTRR